MLDEIKTETEGRMQKAVDNLVQNLAKLRTGRAHAGLLDGIEVEYYGAMTKLSGVASITTSDARTLVVTPYETKLGPIIEKAIRNSDLGLNPSSMGNMIRVPLPALTEERRKQLVKHMQADVEAARVVVRNLRRDANNKLKTLLKQKQISEDLDKSGQDQIQKLTDLMIKEIDKLADKKSAELMQV